LELSQIRYVLRVAEFKNFSKAAQDLSVSQPTLTQQISKLENELGIPLFHRTTRSVSLTAAGADFVSYAVRIMEDLENLNDVMRKHNTLSFDSLHIGIMPHISLFNLPRYISRYFSNNDTVSVNISQATSRELAAELLENKLDVAFIDTQELDSWRLSLLDIRLLRKEPILLAMSKANRLAAAETVNLFDLDSANLWHLRCFESVDDVITHVFRSAGVNYHTRKDFDSAAGLFRAIEQYNGMAFVPKPLCTTNSDGVCFKKTNIPICCSLAIAVPKRQLCSDTVKSFLEYVTSKISVDDKEGAQA